MRIKSYYSKSVETAMLEARRDLGPDAMLVTSRRTSKENSHLGDYEVVFGTMAGGEAEPAPALTQRVAGDELYKELKAVRSQLEDIRRQLGNAAPVSAAAAERNQAYDALIASDIAPELAREVVDEASSAAKNASDQSRELLSAAVTEGIRARIRTAGDLGASITEDNKIIVLVGPPGAGKTTVLSKLAIVKGLNQRRSVRIISVDTHRVATHERLRAYAGIIGVNFTSAGTLSELREALAESRSKDFVFLDTPGYSAGDEDCARDLGRLLNSVPNREVHLVMPASMKRADLASNAARFGIFSPQFLIFTKLDETLSLGSVISESIRSERPLSYFSTGPGVPENLETPKADRLAASLLPATSEQEISAA